MLQNVLLINTQQHNSCFCWNDIFLTATEKHNLEGCCVVSRWPDVTLIPRSIECTCRAQPWTALIKRQHQCKDFSRVSATSASQSPKQFSALSYLYFLFPTGTRFIILWERINLKRTLSELASLLVKPTRRMQWHIKSSFNLLWQHPLSRHIYSPCPILLRLFIEKQMLVCDPVRNLFIIGYWSHLSIHSHWLTTFLWIISLTKEIRTKENYFPKICLT